MAAAAAGGNPVGRIAIGQRLMDRLVGLQDEARDDPDCRFQEFLKLDLREDIPRFMQAMIANQLDQYQKMGNSTSPTGYENPLGIFELGETAYMAVINAFENQAEGIDRIPDFFKLSAKEIVSKMRGKAFPTSTKRYRDLVAGMRLFLMLAELSYRDTINGKHPSGRAYSLQSHKFHVDRDRKLLECINECLAREERNKLQRQ